MLGMTPCKPNDNADLIKNPGQYEATVNEVQKHQSDHGRRKILTGLVANTGQHSPKIDTVESEEDDIGDIGTRILLG